MVIFMECRRDDPFAAIYIIELLIVNNIELRCYLINDSYV